MPSAPFATHSVSLRLYPHNELAAPDVVAELCAQAEMALRLGFDGIMTSEHHGGFPGYLPNPLQMVAFLLEDSPEGWAAACPLLLPLRPTSLVAEETAWLAARHPGRVGLGVAAGALQRDFDAMDLPLDTAIDRFKEALPRLVAMLQGRDLREVEEDPALRRCRDHPVPVLSAAASPGAARRAARCGAGLVLEGMSAPPRLARICAAYDEEGGAAPKVLIRRVWIGAPDATLVTRQRRVYDSYGSTSTGFGDDQTVSGADPAEVAERLLAVWKESGADALNLRVHLPGISAPDVRAQIARLAEEVVPRLRLGRLAELSP
jgi:alkanesulfonate monooxygenase SsuD/methylene tetrahydromethanopterin reductase-like flavin-dependent oxidoreductase (luciferase family)